MIKRMKGTYDITSDIRYYQAIEKQIQKVSRLFNYQEIRTPHFEQQALFHRSVGQDTDIVSKETYDFKDRGGRMNTLRPEGTAGVVRAFIENKLYAEPKLPQKYYYLGNMFRYERPQKGRFREFYQFGAEAFGSNHPAIDAEIIAYAVTLLRGLKLNNVTVHLNTLGDKASKAAFEVALKNHFKDDIEHMCQDCQTRYQENPLRILDCKVDQDKAIMQSAPKTIDYLTKTDQKHFTLVQDYLKAMNIDVIVDHNLVRGLDYYTHTVFEIKVSKDLLGSQNAICGGGRYNHLVETLGGPEVPAVGFAFGIERLVMALKENDYPLVEDAIHLYLLILDDTARLKAVEIAQKLRLGGIITELDYMEKSFKAQFKQSAHHNARFVGILGENEVKENQINVKDQQSEVEETIALDDLYIELAQKLTKQRDDCKDCDKGESS